MKRSTLGASDRLSHLSRQEQLRFLISLSHGLTITVRGAYQSEAPESERIKVFITLNELQHQVCGKLRNLLGAEPLLYSDDSFIEDLFAIAGEKHQAALEWNINHAFEAAERQGIAG